ncbi:hypothetical protein C8N35_11023 [Breoghania corrubedonensis]|uniref:Uncharacterized protein n=1 Tax=Breoghania corrubedonensis TaxID=665038 RepID=A0A2T5V1A7_9HYPH|nr:hypothetical protein [Breoghania corrubedonensis]PTW57544.1 hypothetical protein C8N35_11023 [Breoghania corrubedonensis]
MKRLLLPAMAAAFVSVSALGASALPPVTGATPQLGAPVTLVAGKRRQLTQAEVRKAYVGHTATSRSHQTTYKANGTWTNRHGQKGRYTITKGGLLVMTGDINLRLKIFQDGKGYYHQNVRTGEGGHYSVR